jgi:hypothetical protein
MHHGVAIEETLGDAIDAIGVLADVRMPASWSRNLPLETRARARTSDSADRLMPTMAWRALASTASSLPSPQPSSRRARLPARSAASGSQRPS